MISRTTLSYGVAGFAVYFALLGIQTGLLVVGSLLSFLIGGCIGCRSRVLSSLSLVSGLVTLVHFTPGVKANECSRGDSRHARMIINKVVNPRYSILLTEMPTTCPLSPANDQYASQEVMKRRLGDDWMCSVCGKSFTNEGDLESHLVSSHKAPKVVGCLADYCDILRCEPVFGTPKDGVRCDENEMLALRQKCMDMVRDKCSAPYLPTKTRLELEVSVQASLCSYLTCEEYWTTVEDGESGTHYYYTVYTIALCVLLAFLALYFKIASTNIDGSLSIEEILKDADKYELPKPAIIPPDSDMEIRHRGGTIERQWSENE